jgi:hypothetical protein
LLLLFGFVTTTPNDVPTLQRHPTTINNHPGVHLYMLEVGVKGWTKLQEFTWSKWKFPVEVFTFFSTGPTDYFRVQAKGE